MAIRDREYRLLEAISEDSVATQANLAAKLGIAVGSVNWYIKRLISRGYIKATRMDRTRLRYNLTPEGMKAFTRNATQYMKDSLSVYKDFRKQAQQAVALLTRKGIRSVYLHGNNEIMDIMRLTSIESNIEVQPQPQKWIIRLNGYEYELKEYEI